MAQLTVEPDILNDVIITAATFSIFTQNVYSIYGNNGTAWDILADAVDVSWIKRVLEKNKDAWYVPPDLARFIHAGAGPYYKTIFKLREMSLPEEQRAKLIKIREAHNARG